jgi:hypothetical protein
LNLRHFNGVLYAPAVVDMLKTVENYDWSKGIYRADSPYGRASTGDGACLFLLNIEVIGNILDCYSS